MNNSSSILKHIQAFYKKSSRMPSYSEIAELLGLSSKESAFRQVSKLCDSGELRKDARGKLLPPKSFMEARTKPTQTFAYRELPLLGLVEAGLPSDSEESTLDMISLDEWLVPSHASTFVLRVKGDSMIDAGIYEGDHVLADTKRSPKLGDIVIAQVDGGVTMKYLRTDGKQLYLEPANDDYSDIYPMQELEVQAVVTAVIRKLK